MVSYAYVVKILILGINYVSGMNDFNKTEIIYKWMIVYKINIHVILVPEKRAKYSIK